MNVGAVAVFKFSVPVSLELSVGSRAQPAGRTVCADVPVLVTWTWNVWLEPAGAVAVRLGWVTSRPWPCAAGVPLPSWMDIACCTALRALTRPAPCSSAGTWRSVALLTMICLTSAALGRTPPWVFSYAWMTSAAAPAVSGDDWLVPPNSWMLDGRPTLFRQPAYSAGLAVHTAQPRSPGATTSTVCGPNCVKPPEDRPEMLSLIQPPASSWLAKDVVCR